MGKIKVIKKMVVEYQCSVCGTKYTNKKDALKCAKMPCEQKIFKIGDLVTNTEELRCACGRKPYLFEGKIIGISRPQAPDEEYEKKWLGWKKERLTSHVFLYEVSYECPVCHIEENRVFFAPELKKI